MEAGDLVQGHRVHVLRRDLVAPVAGWFGRSTRASQRGAVEKRPQRLSTAAAVDGWAN
jgi:hypothetical protein